MLVHADLPPFSPFAIPSHKDHRSHLRKSRRTDLNQSFLVDYGARRAGTHIKTRDKFLAFCGFSSPSTIYASTAEQNGTRGSARPPPSENETRPQEKPTPVNKV